MNLAQIGDDRSSVQFTGAVYTPAGIAEALVNVVSEIIPRHGLRVLEPSVGDGVFLNGLMALNRGYDVTVVDVDGLALNALKDRISSACSAVTYVNDDFINYASERISAECGLFDLIIGNPPFIRGKNFSEVLKVNVGNFSGVVSYPLKDLKNSWVAFLIASSKLVSEEGVVSLILPYELMTVDYGKKALHYLSSLYERIDIFISKSKAFPSIDQDAVIFLGRKKVVGEGGVYINQIDTMFDLSRPVARKIDLRAEGGSALELSSFLLPVAAVKLLADLRLKCSDLSKYAGSAPGVVSAANDFFILTGDKVEEYGLRDFVIPILKKGSLASYKPIFTPADFQSLLVKSPCYLLNIKGDFDDLDERLKAYIKRGEESGFNLRYKCRNRKNWYEVPIVPREVGFFFKRSHEFPRVCINEADVYLTDTAYGLRVNDGYTIRGICYSFYNSLTMAFAEIDGRFYGGGCLSCLHESLGGCHLFIMSRVMRSLGSSLRCTLGLREMYLRFWSMVMRCCRGSWV